MTGLPPRPSRGSPLRPKLRVAGVGRVLAVGSGKGGVGKSTVAVNLAVALARLGWRVGLLDADVHGPNVPLMLGVRRRADVAGWEALLPVGGRTPPPEQRLPPLERYGVNIMSVGLLVGEEQAALLGNAPLAGLLVRNLLALVEWGELDTLLLDLPPGAGEPLATLLDTVALDAALFVITPQDLALLDSTRLLRACEAAGVPALGVVENMSFLVCPHCGERLQVFHRSHVPRAITSGAVPLLAEIPIEPDISAAADTGRPIVIAAPESRQARVFLDLAERVARDLRLNAS